MSMVLEISCEELFTMAGGLPIKWLQVTCTRSELLGEAGPSSLLGRLDNDDAAFQYPITAVSRCYFGHTP